MSCNTDYTKEEWKDILALTFYAIVAKGKAVRNKISLTRIPTLLKEVVSLQSFLSAGQKKYPDNELISSVVIDLKPSGQNNDKSRFDGEIPDLETLVERVNQYLLKNSDDTEASEFRAFVYELAYEVCKSAGGGLLGLSENIDAAEAELLHRLKSSLLAT